MNALDGRYLIMCSVYGIFSVLVSIMCLLYGISQKKRAGNSVSWNLFSVVRNFFPNKKMHNDKENAYRNQD